jgi:Amt family ammonium transporter
LNTNLCTAVAMLVWIGWDLIYKDKPSLIGSVNGMITGLVAITPAAGLVNGYGAVILGVVGATVVWMSIRYLSRVPPFRNVDDTLGVIYTHGIAGLVGGLMVGLLADPNVYEYVGGGYLSGLFINGSATLLRWQAETALWVIVFSGVGTFILLKLVGLVIPLRATEQELEIGDHAIHGHEVYPADVASLGSFGSPSLQPAPASGGGSA